MASRSFDTLPADAPSYEEVMNSNGPGQQFYPKVMPNTMPVMPNTMPVMPNAMQVLPVMPQPYYPQTVQPQPSSTLQIQVHNISIGGLSATCQSCRAPLHTRVGYVSTCTTHCAFLFCCLFLCWPCAPFVYCTKRFREPTLFCVNCGAGV